VCSDGDELIVVADDAAFQPTSGQLVMSFAVRQLEGLVARRPPPAPADEVLPETAYACFRAGVDDTDDARAERRLQRALGLDPALAAAWTNLGNIHERRGERGAARTAYEKALALDPEQPEARYNLANVLADIGAIDLALAEYRRVVAQVPG